MGAHTYADHEHIEIRQARTDHRCWSWLERCTAPGDGYDGNPPCTRIIAAGERYVASTIYPGHDSGYADKSPVSSAFCMPCAGRWVNLRRGLERLAALRADGGDDDA